MIRTSLFLIFGIFLKKQHSKRQQIRDSMTQGATTAKEAALDPHVWSPNLGSLNMPLRAAQSIPLNGHMPGTSLAAHRPHAHSRSYGSAT
jgi:hypothetical protein